MSDALMVEACMVDAAGKILNALRAPDQETVAANTPDGATVVLSWPPDWQHTWDGSQWQPVTASIEEARAATWDTLQAARTAQVYGTFAWDGSVFQCDADSQNLILGAAVAAFIAVSTGQDFSESWTLADNTQRVLTGPQMIAVGQAMRDWISACFAIGVGLRAEVEAAATLDDLAALHWPTS